MENKDLAVVLATQQKHKSKILRLEAELKVAKFEYDQFCEETFGISNGSIVDVGALVELFHRCFALSFQDKTKTDKE